MEIVYQPKGSLLCGQCVIAMITKQPLEEVIKLIGHEKRTTAKELQKALRHYGFETAGTLQRVYRLEDVPDRCIVRLTYKSADTGQMQSHWIIKFFSMVYCSVNGLRSLETLIRWSKGRVTSYLPQPVKM